MLSVCCYLKCFTAIQKPHDLFVYPATTAYVEPSALLDTKVVKCCFLVIFCGNCWAFGYKNVITFIFGDSWFKRMSAFSINLKFMSLK